MKRIIVAVLLTALLISTAACSSKSRNNTSEDEKHWSNSLPSDVSGSDNYIIESRTEYRSREITTQEVLGDWSGWSAWSENEEKTDEYKTVESKQQYRYYRFVCPKCGADWYGFTKCTSCGKSNYVYGSSDWGSNLVEGVHYMWYDQPQEDIKWEKATSDGTALRSKLDTKVNWYYNNNVPGDYYWTRTLYRFRTRDVISTKTSYGEFTNWSTKKIEPSDALDVEIRTVYRYSLKSAS